MLFDPDASTCVSYRSLDALSELPSNTASTAPKAPFAVFRFPFLRSFHWVVLLPLFIGFEGSRGLVEIIGRLFEVQESHIVSVEVSFCRHPHMMGILGHLASYHEFAQLGLFDLLLFAFQRPRTQTDASFIEFGGYENCPTGSMYILFVRRSASAGTPYRSDRDAIESLLGSTKCRTSGAESAFDFSDNGC
jgi:hypothetical protein